MISLTEIDKANNIVILTNSDSFSESSALYTYVLQLHKKVSLVCEKDALDSNLACVPWYKNTRQVVSASADLIIDMRIFKNSLYEIFITNDVKINKKMATALYAGLFKNCHNSFETKIDGKIFAIMAHLIELEAEYSLCNELILKSQPLSLFRLKAIMFKDMTLLNGATVAIFHISRADLKSSGATLKEAYIIMKESLSVIHVQIAILLDSDRDNELIQLIKGN